MPGIAKPSQDVLYGYSDSAKDGAKQVVNVTAPSMGSGSKLILSDGTQVNPYDVTAKSDIKSVGFNKSTGSQAGLEQIYKGKFVTPPDTPAPAAATPAASTPAAAPATSSSKPSSSDAAATVSGTVSQVQEAFVTGQKRRRTGQNKSTTLITGGQGLFGNTASTSDKKLFGQ